MSWKIKNLLNKGYSQVEEGKFGEATETFRKLAELSPDNSEFCAHLGESYFLNKEYDKALAAFQRRDEIVLSSDPLTPYIQGYRGCVFFEQGNYEQAKTLLGLAVQ